MIILKKFKLPIIVAAVTLVAMIVVTMMLSVAKKPSVTEAQFPFSITYEYDGEVRTYSGTFVAVFTGNGGYADPTNRCYKGYLLETGEEGEPGVCVEQNPDGSHIRLYSRLIADYMLGEPGYELDCRPSFVYGDAEGADHEDEETLLAQGVKLISYDYPEPIDNTLVFSHFTYMSGVVVLPLLLVSILAFLAIVIFVKKDEDVSYGLIDRVSLLANIPMAVIVLPILTVFGMFADIVGGGPELSYKLGYLSSSFTVLGIAASVCLRRKGYSKSGLVVQFAGIFTIILMFISSLIESLFA